MSENTLRLSQSASNSLFFCVSDAFLVILALTTLRSSFGPGAAKWSNHSFYWCIERRGTLFARHVLTVISVELKKLPNSRSYSWVHVPSLVFSWSMAKISNVPQVSYDVWFCLYHTDHGCGLGCRRFADLLATFMLSNISFVLYCTAFSLPGRPRSNELGPSTNRCKSSKQVSLVRRVLFLAAGFSLGSGTWRVL